MGWASQAASASGCRRPTAACSKGTKIQLCVCPTASAFGGGWLYQAASAASGVVPAGSAGAAGGPASGGVAGGGASGRGTRWPGHERTCGGDPRQQTHPRLFSRKSSASRRGPWVEQTGGEGTALQRRQTHSGAHFPVCRERVGAQCMWRSGSSCQAASDMACTESTSISRGQQTGRMCTGGLGARASRYWWEVVS